MSDRLVAGGAVSKVDPKTTGLHPAWRAAGAFTVFGAMWEGSTSAQDIAWHWQRVAESMVVLRALAPESGHTSRMWAFCEWLHVQGLMCGTTGVHV